MGIEQNLNVSQQQTLTISTHMIHQLSLLHMALPDVCKTVDDALNSNPLLERNDAPAETVDAPAEKNDAPDRQSLKNDFAGDNFYVRKKNDRSASWNIIENQSYNETLSDYLKEQLVDFPLTMEQTALCTYIIESLDSKGYFTENIEETAKAVGVTPFDFTQMLYVVQSFDPPGIGAQNLEECLLLQLATSNNFNTYTIKIVKDCLTLLAKNDIATIAKHLGIDRSSALLYCNIVRSLSPVPSSGYCSGETDCYIVPDALVTADKYGFTIYMNDSLIPPLTLNDDYIELAGQTEDKELQAYLQRHINEAKTLISDVTLRQNTMYRLIQCIVSMQPQYFRDGKTLLPMKMTEVAEKLELHTSTISRAVHDKYIVCAAGTVSIKSLFSFGLASGAGESLSSVVIKRKLSDFISAENSAAPLSDEELRKLFEKDGVSISRRTVAKYREELGIPSSSKRKSKFI